MYRRLTPWWTQPLALAGVLSAVALAVPAPADAATGEPALTTGEFAAVLFIEVAAVGLLAIVVTGSVLRLLLRWSDRR